MQVVLKRPHGMANPGLFDYSLWLAQRGVGATGYVASGQKPDKLAEPAGPAGFVSVDLLRGYLAARLTEVLAGHPQITHRRVEDGPGRRLGRSFGVKLWPTLIALRDGQEQARVVRPTAPAQIEALCSALAPRP